MLSACQWGRARTIGSLITGLAAFERKAREEDAKKEQSGGIRSYAEVCEQRTQAARLQQGGGSGGGSSWLERRHRKSSTGRGGGGSDDSEDDEVAEVEDDEEEQERQAEESERQRIFEAEMQRRGTNWGIVLDFHTASSRSILWLDLFLFHYISFMLLASDY